MSFTTTRSTLMHAALVHISPKLREFDLITSGTLRSSGPLMPTEILLSIRARLLPILIEHVIATSTAALEQYEASLRRLVCSQCTVYNEFVYGPDVWNWNLYGPCSCLPDDASTHRLNPKQFHDRQHWLESHLSHESLLCRGLQPQSSDSSSAIWDIAAAMLHDFGCEAIRRDATHGDATGSSTESVIIIPLSKCRTDERILFRRLERDLGLRCDYTDPRTTPPGPGSPGIVPPLTALSVRGADASQLKDITSSPVAAPIIFSPQQILDTVFAPFSAVVAVFYTLIFYYFRPRALRLF